MQHIGSLLRTLRPALVLLLFLVSPTALAQVSTLNYQGLLTDTGGNPVPDGEYNFNFRIYDRPSGGGAIWGAEGQKLFVGGGVFSATLGRVLPIDLPFDRPYYLGITVGAAAELSPRIPLTAAPYSFFSKTVADSSISTSKLATGAVTADKLADRAVTLAKMDTAGVPSGAALVFDGTDFNWGAPMTEGVLAGLAAGNGLTGGGTSGVVDVAIDSLGVTTTMLAGRAVTGAKIALEAVDTDQLADAAVTRSKIAPLAVGSAQLGNGAVTPAKIGTAGADSSDVLTFDGTVPAWRSLPASFGDVTAVNAGDGLAGGGLFGDVTLQIAGAGVTSAMIRDSAITSAKMAPLAVTAEKISGDGASPGDVLAFNGTEVIWQTTTGSAKGDITSVTAGDGLDGGGPQGDVTLFVADDGIVSTMIEDGAVGTVDLADNAVTGVKVADSTLTTADLVDEAVTGPKLAALAVTTTKISGEGAAEGDVLGFDGSDVVWRSLSGVGSGDITSVTAGDGLDGGGPQGDVTLFVPDEGITSAMVEDASLTAGDLADGAVTTPKLADEAVAPAKINPAGAAADQVLRFNGTSVEWANPRLQVPYTMTGNVGGPILTVTNTAPGAPTAARFEGVVRVTDTLRTLGDVRVDGSLSVIGTLSKGSGTFKIDHPLDPYNKYLYHSFVESPDMMNVYNGNVVLDEQGEAVVEMPDWFEALNRDFRYQLTCIGGFSPVYVAEEVRDGKFRIAGGTEGLKVSWQVTGIRQDPYAEQHRIEVEVPKPPAERGTLLHPDVYPRAQAQPESNR